eukprot:scaffold13423_cov115-Skeletonema_dohrnii-CCMP3373.AAC.3
MSAAADEADEICAACGIPACDDITLKLCTACKSVRYCGVECQRKHRSQHKRACKKRAAELRDEILFRQPEGTHFGDCPICFIPISTGTDEDGNMNTAAHYPCCSKMICNGCIYESALQQTEQKCPFCRTPFQEGTDTERMVKKREAANDPHAIRGVAGRCLKEGNFIEGFKYMNQAAKGGNMDAHYQLARMYIDGKCVEQDMKMAFYHWEEAAIGGHHIARFGLGLMEGNHGRHERQVKHLIIAANQGWGAAVKQLKMCYEEGHVSKDEFAAALRAYQRAIDATKSPQREAAKRNPELLNVKRGNNL